MSQQEAASDDLDAQFLDPDGMFVVEGMALSEGILVNEEGMAVPAATLVARGYFNTESDVEEDLELRLAILWPQNIRTLANYLLMAAENLEQGMEELPEDATSQEP